MGETGDPKDFSVKIALEVATGDRNAKPPGMQQKQKLNCEGGGASRGGQKKNKATKVQKTEMPAANNSGFRAKTFFSGTPKKGSEAPKRRCRHVPGQLDTREPKAQDLGCMGQGPLGGCGMGSRKGAAHRQTAQKPNGSKQEKSKKLLSRESKSMRVERENHGGKRTWRASSSK